ncbi:MAG: SAM-dependent methyltransferase [Gammaproteobacteria bacterium]|nr:SAM-dependent methyltransferase [Gammaproteobacteria bacterium]
MFQAVKSLPEPDADAKKHSHRLTEVIREEIDAAGGSIGFDRYMELALYRPGLGYYSAGAGKFGKFGDFVTAPEVSALFSQCLARQCISILNAIPQGNILELGAGTGVMAAQILETLADQGLLPPRYYILELSAELRQRQAETLQRRVPQWYERVCWLSALPQGGFRGVVLANELLDAMPVHCFYLHEGCVFERRVGVSNRGRLVWTKREAATALRARVEHLCGQLPQALPTGYHSEVNLRLDPWFKALGKAMEQVVMILIDYGYPRREYYHPQRIQGTLLCHYRHLAHEDPFFYPGLQDISANVDFTAVAQAGVESGLQLLGYTTQAHFLLASGLDEIFSEVLDEGLRLEYSQQIKRLTLPSEMGERFQVIALGKRFDAPIPGFGLRDLRIRL